MLPLPRWVEWIKNINQPYANYKKLTSNISRLKVRGWKIICQANINQKTAEVGYNNVRKSKLQSKKITRDRQGN